MADHQAQKNDAKDRGMFDFLKKKDEEKSQGDAVMADAEQKDEGKEKKHTLVGTLQRSHSSSSSSSDEEVGEDGEKKKKKKKNGLKEKNHKKISGGKEENAEKHDHETENAEVTYPEKKGFLDKIKEILPGQHRKAEDGTAGCHATEHSPRGEEKEKKGILEKIKEKLPGHHNEEDKVHKEN